MPLYRMDETEKFVHFERTPFGELEKVLEDVTCPPKTGPAKMGVLWG